MKLALFLTVGACLVFLVQASQQEPKAASGIIKLGKSGLDSDSEAGVGSRAIHREKRSRNQTPTLTIDRTYFRIRHFGVPDPQNHASVRTFVNSQPPRYFTVARGETVHIFPSNTRDALNQQINRLQYQYKENNHEFSWRRAQDRDGVFNLYRENRLVQLTGEPTIRASTLNTRDRTVEDVPGQITPMFAVWTERPGTRDVDASLHYSGAARG